MICSMNPGPSNVATYLLDSSIFSLLVADNQDVRLRVTKLQFPDRVTICSVVRGEVLFGVERLPEGKRRRELARKVTDWLAALSCQSAPEVAGDHYARIKRGAERRGTPLGENDLWIAATAVALGAVLVTKDTDFDRVPELRCEDWSR